jgi:bisphosphoglycerate-dependent phosphoglycerate mutase
MQLAELRTFEKNSQLLDQINEIDLQHKVNLNKKFHAALQGLNIDRSAKKFPGITFGNPTVHSLRHSFAVNTLKDRVQKEKIRKIYCLFFLYTWGILSINTRHYI